MSFLEMIFVGCVIGGFISFAAALAWVAHVDYKREPTLPRWAGDE